MSFDAEGVEPVAQLVADRRFRDRLAERTRASRAGVATTRHTRPRFGARSPRMRARTGDSTSTLTTSRPSRLNPRLSSATGSGCARRVPSPPAGPSTAPCAATSARAIPAGRRSPPAWGAPAFQHWPGSMRTALTIGARLKAIATMPAAPAVNTMPGRRCPAQRHRVVAGREQPHEQVGGPGREETAQRAARGASSNPSTNSC